jgi:hypothetical protein
VAQLSGPPISATFLIEKKFWLFFGSPVYGSPRAGARYHPRHYARIQSIHAQMKPPTYVVVAIRKITDADTFKTLLPKEEAANTVFNYI